MTFLKFLVIIMTCHERFCECKIYVKIIPCVSWVNQDSFSLISLIYIRKIKYNEIELRSYLMQIEVFSINFLSKNCINCMCNTMDMSLLINLIMISFDFTACLYISLLNDKYCFTLANVMKFSKSRLKYLIINSL